MKYLNENEIERISGDTGKELGGQMRVNIIIEKRQGDDAPWEGGLNGYFFRIRRGIKVNVPLSIAELIEQNERVTRISEESVKVYTRGRGKKLNA